MRQALHGTATGKHLDLEVRRVADGQILWLMDTQLMDSSFDGIFFAVLGNCIERIRKVAWHQLKSS